MFCRRRPHRPGREVSQGNGVFEDARANGCNAVLVFSLATDDEACAAISKGASVDRVGACLRLSWKDFDKDNLVASIEARLKAVQLTPAQVDLILDMGTTDFEPFKVSSYAVASAISGLPSLNRWRSFTLIGSSFPATFANVGEKPELVPRAEWIFYRHLVERLDKHVRIPAYGDYGSAHPDLVELALFAFHVDA